MTVIKRRAAAAGAALLLGLSLTACGGDDGESADEGSPEASSDSSDSSGAAVEDFCTGYQGDEIPLPELDPEASPEEQSGVLLEFLREQAKNLEDIGTPDDMPDDAREGFQLTLDKVNDLDEDEVAKAFEEQNEDFFDLSEDEQAKVDALDEYVAESCS